MYNVDVIKNVLLSIAHDSWPDARSAWPPARGRLEVSAVASRSVRKSETLTQAPTFGMLGSHASRVAFR